MVLLALLLSGMASASAKPNFILLLADDWGWGDNAFNVGTTVTSLPQAYHGKPSVTSP